MLRGVQRPQGPGQRHGEGRVAVPAVQYPTRLPACLPVCRSVRAVRPPAGPFFFSSPAYPLRDAANSRPSSMSYVNLREDRPLLRRGTVLLLQKISEPLCIFSPDSASNTAS